MTGHLLWQRVQLLLDVETALTHRFESHKPGRKNVNISGTVVRVFLISATSAVAFHSAFTTEGMIAPSLASCTRQFNKSRSIFIDTGFYGSNTFGNNLPREKGSLKEDKLLTREMSRFKPKCRILITNSSFRGVKIS